MAPSRGHNKGMTITLDLPPEVEGALTQEARRRGMTPEGLALDELRRLVVAPPTEEAADGDDARQDALRETLFRILDQAQACRPSQRMIPCALPTETSPMIKQSPKSYEGRDWMFESAARHAG